MQMQMGVQAFEHITAEELQRLAGMYNHTFGVADFDLENSQYQYQPQQQQDLTPAVSGLGDTRGFEWDAELMVGNWDWDFEAWSSGTDFKLKPSREFDFWFYGSVLCYYPFSFALLWSCIIRDSYLHFTLLYFSFLWRNIKRCDRRCLSSYSVSP